MSTEINKCVIIGSGPAGYTSAIYASRAGLEPIVFEGNAPGGQITMTEQIDNFPGYPEGISGFGLMEDIKKQALRFGAEVRNKVIKKVDFSKRPFVLETEDGDEVIAKTVIISTGASARWLGLESERKFRGMGVSTCATCDGFFYRKKDVAVVGGGDTACSEALYLSGLCNKVYLIVRRDVLRATKAVQEQIFSRENIEIVWKHKPLEILGDDSGVTGIRVISSEGEATKDIDVMGVFVAIGNIPNTDVFKGQLELNENGYIVTKGHSSYTSVDGVFAAGDVQDPTYKQAIVAAGSGAKAAIDCERWLMENPL
ncbi:MAG: thioredoxin-disulfide reductase [Bacteroidales bacterium]|nr:thioredoxin-disulfide reductase [Bacteroidales bacterium]MDY6423958.1 thioredoxin-disulfide reductase [Bacteroidales bacterium]